MRTLLYSIVFIALIAGAVFLVDSTGNKLDLPFEAGQLHAPDIDRGHGDDGHGDGHGEEAAASHG